MCGMAGAEILQQKRAAPRTAARQTATTGLLRHRRLPKQMMRTGGSRTMRASPQSDSSEDSTWMGGVV